MNKFTILSNDILSPNAQGASSAIFNAGDFALPYPILGITGTLQDVIDNVGVDNIILAYYANVVGKIPEHTCLGIYTLYVYPYYGPRYSTRSVSFPYVNLVQTSDVYNTAERIQTPWTSIGYGNGSEIMTRLDSYSDCFMGPECNCEFTEKGGWSQVFISMKIEVSINLNNPYCLADQNRRKCLKKNTAPQAILAFTNFY
jgi:hypothetical protein